jgi:RNA-directed DNA polymerase
MTRLVTLDGGLPQGSPTSTIVANLVIVPLALRIERLAKVHGSDYTQYIDDGTISGPGYLENLRPLIDRIIRQTGLQASPKPEKRLTKYSHQEQTVTGVRVNYRIDVPSKKVEGVRANLDKLDQELQLGRRLSRKQLVSMTGKIGHIGSLNRGSGRCLARRMARLSASILDHS